MVLPIASKAAENSYSKLFADNPDLEFRFGSTDMAQQKMKLAHAVGALVHSLHRLEDMTPLRHKTGSRHRHYGATEEGYRAVGAALLHTLAAGLGDAWSESAAAAWKRLYDHVSSKMIEGILIQTACRT